MENSSFLSLVHNASLLLAIAIIFDVMALRWSGGRATITQIPVGIILGGIGITLMLTPWVYTPGIIFDTRSVLLGISGLFFGSIPTLIAMAMTAALRWYQGGAATLTGICVIIATGSLGIAWRHIRRFNLVNLTFRELYLFGLLIHLVMLAFMFLLPLPTALQVLSNITIPVLVIYPLGTALLGALMINRLQRGETANSLAESERRLRLAVQASNVGFYIHDISTGREFYSSEWKHQLGYADDEIKDDPNEWVSRIHPDDLEKTLALENAYIRGERSDYEAEFRLRHKNGSYRWILSRAVMQYDELGKPIRMHGCHIDITRQKQNEAAILASEQRFRSLAESSQDYIMLYDRSGRHIYMNPAGIEISGFTPESILGKTHRQAGFGEELSDMWEADIEKVFTTGSPSQRLFEWESVSGSVFLDWRLSPVYGPDGVIELVLGVSRDITAIKKAELALVKSEEKYRVLTESIKDVVWILDTETLYFRYVSPSVERLRGFTPEEVIAQPIHHALTPEATVAVKDLIRTRSEDYTSGRTPVDQFYTDEVEQPCKDGSTVWTEVVTTYYTNRENGHVEVRGVTRDISQRKKAEAEILAAQVELQRLLSEAGESRQVLLKMVEDQKRSEEQIRLLNTELEERVRRRTAQLETVNNELEAFAYSVSHDLRAPLRAMDGFSAALLEGYTDKLDDQGRHYLTRIQEASRRMGQLISDLLNLSRITRSTFNRQQVNLSELAREIASELLAQEHQRQVKFNIRPDLLVEGDPHLLKIVLENLLNNAFKFTGQCNPAIITVDQVQQDAKPVYFVRDNGAGFNMEYAGKLFAPFQRLHGMNEYPGTGIGLVTVQRIITRHGGRIWPEAAVNNGATFYFTLGESA